MTAGMDKCTWTLVRARTTSRDGFDEWALSELGDALGAHLPGVSDARVTLQPPEAFGNATVPLGDGDALVDAMLEVTTTESYLPLDDWHAYLRARCAHVQGWRVAPTVIYDHTREPSPGEACDGPSIFVWLERLDGTTPEHFSREWYRHAGYGTDDAGADNPGGLYRQNRVLEPLTPTAWLVHGYTQLHFGFLIPDPGQVQYERTRGEEPFDRWPARYVQGPEHRIA
jgi:hypothetical protein